MRACIKKNEKFLDEDENSKKLLAEISLTQKHTTKNHRADTTIYATGSTWKASRLHTFGIAGVADYVNNANLTF